MDDRVGSKGIESGVHLVTISDVEAPVVEPEYLAKSADRCVSGRGRGARWATTT